MVFNMMSCHFASLASHNRFYRIHYRMLTGALILYDASILATESQGQNVEKVIRYEITARCVMR